MAHKGSKSSKGKPGRSREASVMESARASSPAFAETETAASQHSLDPIVSAGESPNNCQPLCKEAVGVESSPGGPSVVGEGESAARALAVLTATVQAAENVCIGFEALPAPDDSGAIPAAEFAEIIEAVAAEPKAASVQECEVAATESKNESVPAAEVANVQARTDREVEAPQAEPAGDEPGTLECTSPAAPVYRNLTQHHVSKLLSDVLEGDAPEESVGQKKRVRYPVIVDVFMGLGLLIAVAGFTIGLFKMYVTHLAQQRIMEGDYQSAIGIIRGAKMPPYFSSEGADADDTLAQAVYLDALQKLDASHTDEAAVELQQIRPGSKYFDQAQKLLSDNFEPSQTTLSEASDKDP